MYDNEGKKEKEELEQELKKAMGSCGHFLYHRKGGRFGQEKILQILYENGFISTENAVDQQLLQAMMNVQSGSISEIIRKMEMKGTVGKVQNKEDRRKNSIYLTEKGSFVLKEKIIERNRQEAAMFDALSESEQRELLRMLKILLESWHVSEEIQNKHG